jgi:hypothetical protein
MHKSIIIISVNPKIVINSPEVCFDITRQCAQVELKNINIFSKKKIYIITLCNFCLRS